MEILCPKCQRTTPAAQVRSNGRCYFCSNELEAPVPAECSTIHFEADDAPASMAAAASAICGRCGRPGLHHASVSISTKPIFYPLRLELKEDPA